MSTRIIEISSSDDVIDVRDIIARVEELESDPESTKSYNRLSEDCADCGAEPNEEHAPDCEGGSHSVEAAEELLRLTALLDDLRGNGGDEQWRGDWYPITLIRDSYFEDYARELADDIGAVDRNASWPNTYIDWEAASGALQQDYSTVEFDGVTYWYR